MDNLCDRLLSTIIGEYGIVKVLESVADKSYNGTVRAFLKELIEEIQTQKINNSKNYSSCCCPGCTGRG